MSWSYRGVLVVLPVALCAACATATPEEDLEDPAPPECTGEYRVGADGECSIPSIGKGDVETPDAAFEPPTLDNSDLEEQRGYYLSQEGDGVFSVYVGQTARIGVRVITNTGEAAPGHTVLFTAVPIRDGEDVFSTLGAARSITNEFGVAHVDVIAGHRPESFLIQMTAEDTEGLTYQIDVVLPPEGRDPGPVPGGGRPGNPDGIGEGQCLATKGVYNVVNLYEPGQYLGDDIFETLDLIHRVLSEPGQVAGDWIEDRIDGIWGDVIRAAVSPVIDYLYRFIVDNYAPDWLRWTLIITEDITAVLTEMEIQGTMELGPAGGPECTLRGKHRWEKLVFLWRAGCPPGDDQCGRYEVELAQMGISASESEFDARLVRSLGPTADMEIAEHRLQLNIGVAVLWFIENVILPQRLNVNSFGEVLGLVLPCDAMGQLAADYIGGAIFGFAVAPFVEEACEAGLEALGNWLTRQLAERMSVDTFPMAGQCKLRDNSGDRLADVIREGRWTQGLQGDFTGERR